MIQPMRKFAGVCDRRRARCAACVKILDLLGLDPVADRPARSAKAPPDARVQTGDPLALDLRRVTAPPLRRFEAGAAPGQRVAILGPNGAGKSRLLALAVGLETLDHGPVRIAGRRPSGFSEAERAAAPCLAGARSPILACSLRRALTMGAARRPCDTAISLTARAVGLGAVLERLGGLDGRVAEGARTLSAGEARLLLARAALSRAGLLLLDEPETGLDGDGPALVARLLAGTRATVVVVTQDPAIARKMDEAWLIKAGRLAARGPPEDIVAARGRRSGCRPPDAA